MNHLFNFVTVIFTALFVANSFAFSFPVKGGPGPYMGPGLSGVYCSLPDGPARIILNLGLDGTAISNAIVGNPGTIPACKFDPNSALTIHGHWEYIAGNKINIILPYGPTFTCIVNSSTSFDCGGDNGPYTFNLGN